MASRRELGLDKSRVSNSDTRAFASAVEFDMLADVIHRIEQKSVCTKSTMIS